MPKKISEKDLYPTVLKWANKHFKCFRSHENVGLRYSRADVFCVRDVGGQLTSEYETIAIEVKRYGGPFATASGQAYGYRVYANRVYLAEYRSEPFSDMQRQIAAQLGIGLIHISTKLKCTEVQMSPRYDPLPSMNSELLEKIRLGLCRVCGVLFETGPQGKGMNHTLLARENLAKAMEGEKGLMYWHRELAARKRKAKLGSLASKKDDVVYERRFICRDCIENLWTPLKDIAKDDR